MSGINDIFSIGKRALLAQQAAMNVTGNNIANAQNPDYSRQDVKFSNDLYIREGNYYIGSGVQIEDVRRLRDQYYDQNYWQENASMSRWDTEAKYGNMVEGVFNDLTGTGLSQVLDDFWNGWTQLSNYPDDASQRANLATLSQQLVDTFHHIEGELRSTSSQAKTELQSSISQVNQIIAQVADVNKKIAAAGNTGGLNNTLLDQRDALIGELSKYIAIEVNYKNDGSVSISSNYKVIVDQSQGFQIKMDATKVNGSDQVSLLLYDNQPLELQSGSLKSMIDTVNATIPEYMQQLDSIAGALVEQVNSYHQNFYNLNGETGIDFFDPNATTAGSIQLSQDIKRNSNNIAVSKDGQSGDGSGAADIANIQHQAVLNNNSATINGSFGAMINGIGENQRFAEQSLENQNGVVNVIENQRQAVMGVSIDEEMVNLIKFQTAFSAASRLIVTVDEMMDTLLNMV